MEKKPCHGSERAFLILTAVAALKNYFGASAGAAGGTITVVEPDEPVAPVDPVEPIEPVEPVAPVSPLGPGTGTGTGTTVVVAVSVGGTTTVSLRSQPAKTTVDASAARMMNFFMEKLPSD